MSSSPPAKENEIQALQDLIVDLERLARYAQHSTPCLEQMQHSNFCNCGLRQAKQALKLRKND